jgi:hypothetical protein
MLAQYRPKCWQRQGKWWQKVKTIIEIIKNIGSISPKNIDKCQVLAEYYKKIIDKKQEIVEQTNKMLAQYLPNILTKTVKCWTNNKICRLNISKNSDKKGNCWENIKNGSVSPKMLTKAINNVDYKESWLLKNGIKHVKWWQKEWRVQCKLVTKSINLELVSHPVLRSNRILIICVVRNQVYRYTI